MLLSAVRCLGITTYVYYLYESKITLIFSLIYTDTDGPAMSQVASNGGTQLHREYPMDVRILEVSDGDNPSYRFEAPEHDGISFDDPDKAQLYADIYFDVNGFEEAGTGERGVPPVIIQAGRDTLAAYFLTQDTVEKRWVASFMGVQPGKVLRYKSRVQDRAANIRNRIEQQNLE